MAAKKRKPSDAQSGLRPETIESVLGALEALDDETCPIGEDGFEETPEVGDLPWNVDGPERERRALYTAAQLLRLLLELQHPANRLRMKAVDAAEAAATALWSPRPIEERVRLARRALDRAAASLRTAEAGVRDGFPADPTEAVRRELESSKGLHNIEVTFDVWDQAVRMWASIKDGAKAPGIGEWKALGMVLNLDAATLRKTFKAAESKRLKRNTGGGGGS